MIAPQEGTLQDLRFDEQNANRHTARGMAALETSLQRFGLGRSILVDKDNRIIAGNATAEQCGATNAAQRVLFVDTDGHTLVAVRRRDLTLGDPRARELALADNRVGQLNLDWDAATIEALDAMDGVELGDWFRDHEIEAILAGEEEPEEEPGSGSGEGDGAPVRVTFTVEVDSTFKEELCGVLTRYCDEHAISAEIR